MAGIHRRDVLLGTGMEPALTPVPADAVAAADGTTDDLRRYIGFGGRASLAAAAGA